MRIAIDFDDCISQTNQLLFTEVKMSLGQENLPYPSTSLKWEDVLKVTPEKLSILFGTISSRHSFHKTLPLIASCKSVLKKLKKAGHVLYIISARPTWGLPYSTIWLREQGLLPFFSRIIHRPRGVSAWGDYKVTEAKELKIDVFIEDAPETATILAKAGIPTILFDMPYNRQVPAHKLLFRAKGWKDVFILSERFRRKSAK